MKHTSTIVFLIALFTACFAALTPDASAQQAVAMVTSVQGSGTYERAGVSKKLEVGAELPDGAVVVLHDGKASLVFMSGDLMELSGGDQLTLGAEMTKSTLSSGGATRGVSKTDGVAVAEEGVGSANNEKWQSQLAYIYGVRGDATVVPVAPRLTVSNPVPVFYWFEGDSLMKGVERTYTLTLMDASGNEIMSEDVRGKVYELNEYAPKSMPPRFSARPGTQYRWNVTEKGKSASPSSGAAFVYIDQRGQEKAAEKIRKLDELRSQGKMDEQAYNSLAAMYLLDERERLFSDAIPFLLNLERLPAGAGYARKQMALLLNRFGNEVAGAAAYFARKSD